MPFINKEEFLKPNGLSVWLNGGAGCLDSETFIPYSVCDLQGRRINDKGGTIEKLYHRFNGLQYRAAGQQPTKNAVEYKIASLGEDGYLRCNRVVGVISSGEKDCFRVTLDDGESIIATADHRFKTDAGYLPILSLRQDSLVFVHRRVVLPRSPQRKVVRDRKFLYVKSHPTARTKVIRGKYVGMDRDYEYRVLPRARAVVEAEQNGLSLSEYVDRLNSGNLDGLLTLDRSVEVHHKDENTLRDSVDNLEVLTTADHARHHADADPKHLLCVPVKRRIAEITFAGKRQTYDVQMESPNNNFVANGFIVHNSGKTLQGMTFPRVMALTFDPTGLDTLKQPENQKYLDNLIMHVPFNGLPLDKLFRFTEEPGEDSLYGALALARKLGPGGERKIETVFLDNFNYLVTLKWTQICESKGVVWTEKQNMDRKEADQRAWYDALGSYLDHFVLQNLLPLATRDRLNVVVSSHLQRESENTIKGIQVARSPTAQEQQAASKRQVNLDSDLSPQVLGSFRQRIAGLPSAMIYLEDRLEQDKEGRETVQYYAYCRRTRSESLDTVILAKNRFGLGTLRLTNGNLYRTILAKISTNAAQSQPESKPTTTASPTGSTKSTSATKGA